MHQLREHRFYLFEEFQGYNKVRHFQNIIYVRLLKYYTTNLKVEGKNIEFDVDRCFSEATNCGREEDGGTAPEINEVLIISFSKEEIICDGL